MNERANEQTKINEDTENIKNNEVKEEEEEAREKFHAQIFNYIYYVRLFCLRK